jgi:hypothetical protein
LFVATNHQHKRWSHLEKKLVVNMYISRARESNYIVLIKWLLGITFIFSSLVFSWMYVLLGDVNMPWTAMLLTLSRKWAYNKRKKSYKFSSSITWRKDITSWIITEILNHFHFFLFTRHWLFIIFLLIL